MEVIPSLLLPATGMSLASVEKQEQVLEITLCLQTAVATCPECKVEQSHVHSRYVRIAADLRWADFRVKLLL